jgi:hypothetical protein
MSKYQTLESAVKVAREFSKGYKEGCEVRQTGASEFNVDLVGKCKEGLLIAIYRDGFSVPN